MPGRRKLLVEMATGTGKTRTAAAFIKRLFEANAITRVLFLVDRIPLAKQTEDAFAEHLPDYPAYVLRAGRRFQDEKRITITTLQSMVNIYREYSAGYFDLVISRRVPPQHLRQVERRAQALRRRADRPHRHARASPTSRTSATRKTSCSCATPCASSRWISPPSRYKLKDAIRDGYLVPYQIYKAKTVKTAAEGGFEVKRDELDWSAMDADDPRRVRGAVRRRRHDHRSTRRPWSAASRSPSATAPWCASSAQVLDNGYIDAKGVLRKPLLGKTIVFAVTKRHAETLAQLFDAGLRRPEALARGALRRLRGVRAWAPTTPSTA